MITSDRDGSNQEQTRYGKSLKVLASSEKKTGVDRIVRSDHSNTLNITPSIVMVGCLVVGCGDLSPAKSPGAWVRYSTDRGIADVGCGSRRDQPRWRLECRSGVWTGHLGNCSASPSLSG